MIDEIKDDNAFTKIKEEQKQADHEMGETTKVK